MIRIKKGKRFDLHDEATGELLLTAKEVGKKITIENASGERIAEMRSLYTNNSSFMLAGYDSSGVESELLAVSFAVSHIGASTIGPGVVSVAIPSIDATGDWFTAWPCTAGESLRDYVCWDEQHARVSSNEIQQSSSIRF